MKNKTVLITGANSGIGKATATALAIQGANIVMLCRNKEKAEAAKKEIIEKTKNNNIEIIIADVSNLNDVRRAAKEFLEKNTKLDVLINNAGLIFGKRENSVDGIEATFATNHLGHFLLTNLLLDTIKNTPKARIIHLSSVAHTIAKPNWDDIENKKKYDFARVYAEAKLYTLMFSNELAKRLEGTGITSNAVHPGLVGSNFGATSKNWYEYVVKLVQPFLISNEKGAATSIYLASSPEVEKISGKYFSKKKTTSPSNASQNKESWKKLWDISEKMVGLASHS